VLRGLGEEFGVTLVEQLVRDVQMIVSSCKCLWVLRRE
jgi:hypothetical protein